MGLDGNTIYFIVFGVVAFLVVLRFGRKDPAKYEEQRKAIMESMKEEESKSKPESELPGEEKPGTDKPK